MTAPAQYDVRNPDDVTKTTDSIAHAYDNVVEMNDLKKEFDRSYGRYVFEVQKPTGEKDRDAAF